MITIKAPRAADPAALASAESHDSAPDGGGLNAKVLFREAKRRERLRRAGALLAVLAVTGGTVLGYRVSQGSGASSTTAASEVRPPVVPAADRAVSLVIDGTDYCVLLESSGVKCWGTNIAAMGSAGVLGNGTAKSSGVPVAVKGLTGAVEVVASSLAIFNGLGFCALLRSGGVRCWGGNARGALGNGGSEKFSDVPVAVKGLTGAVSLASDGNAGFCALLRSGGVRCWGSNTGPYFGAGLDGALGDGGSEKFSDVPVAVKGLTGAVSLASDGNEGYCALLGNGGAKCWGSNIAFPGPGFYGALGDGGHEPYSSVPVTVKGLTGATSFATDPLAYVGDGYCVLLETGRATCWGFYPNARLGDSARAGYANVPVTVKGLTGATSLVGALGDYCALLASGRAQCWGRDASGGLGNGVREMFSSTPVFVKGLTGVKSLASAFGGFCALLTSGRAKCWGANGSLGAGGRATISSTPVFVKGLTGATSIVSNGQGACAVLMGGGVHCWGANNFHELGDGGRETFSNDPVAVVGLGK